MVKKVINVGVEGNDASGDPIREAFIKTNENFNELYSAFGSGDGISITALEEGPDEVTPNSILISNDLGDQYLSKEIEGQGGIEIVNSDPTKLIIRSATSSVNADSRPSLGNNLDANSFNILRLGDPNPVTAAAYGVSEDSFAINRGYADNRYVNLVGDTMTGFLNVPPGASGTQVARSNETVLREGGFVSQMQGPLILERKIQETDDPLTAATKEYIDVSSFISQVNLFVSNQGDDNQFDVPDSRKGRSEGYAFRTLSAACRYSQRLIDESAFTVSITVKDITYSNGSLTSQVLNITPVSNYYIMTILNNGVQTDPRDADDIRPGQIIKGKVSGAIVRIEEIIPGNIIFEIEPGVTVSAERYRVQYVTNPITQPFITILGGEPLEYGNPAKDLQITIFLESGNYYEHYPIRVPENVSIIGDELRRTIIRPRPGRSASWAIDTYFRRDQFFDVNLQVTDRTFGYHYLSDTSKSLYEEHIISANGVVGTISGTGPEWTARITSMTSTANLSEGDIITATNGTGRLGTNGVYTVTSILSLSSIEFKAFSGTTPVAGTVTNIKVGRTITNNGNLDNASFILLQNREFIQEEVIAYVNTVLRGLQYDEAKCRRDTGLIINALAYDMALGSNFASITSARAYYRGTQAAEVLGADKIATLESLDYLQTLLQTLALSSVSDTRIASNIALMKAVISNGLSSVPIIVWPTPSDILSGFSSARNILFNNKAYLQAEIVAYIDQQIAANINNPLSIWYDLDIDGSACSRDVGYIIEAVVYDLTYGGNSQTIDAGSAYFLGALGILNTEEVDPTIAAYTVLKERIEAVILNNPLSNFQTSVPRVGGTAGSSDAANTAKARMDIIISIIETDGDLPTRVNPSLTSVESIISTDFSTIIAATSTLQDDVIDYINNNFFLYNEDLCYRDVGLIVDALGYDLVYGGFYRSLEAANSYYESASSLIAITDQLDETSAAINYIGIIAQRIIQKLAPLTLYQNTYPASSRILQSNSMSEVAEAGSTTAVADLVGFMLDIIAGSSSINDPKENNAMGVDVFLMNDATIIRNLSCQEHGGFMCVLDPLGQILTKSPYVQTASSFSRSINERIFAGGMLVDAFAGNIEAQITSRIDEVTIAVDGLTKRLPNLPTAFYVKGIRFQVDLITEWDQETGTALVHINPATPDDIDYTEASNFQDSTTLFLSSTSIEFLSAGNNSMLSNDYTQLNDLGYGLAAINGGLLEAVGVFTYYNQISYFADTGGQIRSVGGSSAHGAYGLVAANSYPLEVPDDVFLLEDMVIGASIYSPFDQYTGATGDRISGSGTGATFNITVNEASYIVTLNNPGTGYTVGAQINIPGSFFGGITGANDLVITVSTTTSGPPGPISTFSITGTIPTGAPVNDFYSREGDSFVYVDNLTKNFRIPNGSELELVTGTSPNRELIRYVINNSSEVTDITGAPEAITGTLYRLNLATAGLLGGGGLDQTVTNNVRVTMRMNTGVFLYDLNQQTATRPSTALVFDEATFNVNRVIGFNAISSEIGEFSWPLGSNTVTITAPLHGLTTPYPNSYTSLAGTNITGSGINARFNVTVTLSGYTVSIHTAGTGYALTNTIRILGTSLGGTSPANDIVITVTNISGPGGITGISFVGEVTQLVKYVVFIPNVGAVPSRGFYPITVINANQFSLDVVSTSETGSTGSVTYGDANGQVEATLKEPFRSVQITTYYNANTQPVQPFTVTIDRSFDGTNPLTANQFNCINNFALSLNQEIKFTGTVGGVTAGTSYFVKALVGTNRFTISNTRVSGIAGPTRTLTSQTASMFGTTDIQGASYFTWGVTGSYKFAINDLSVQDEGRIQYGIDTGFPIIVGWRGRIHEISGYINSTANGTDYAVLLLDDLTGVGLVEPVGVIEGGWDNNPGLRGVLKADSPGTCTVNISTVRVTGHDLLDIGTGSYSQTNFPNTIFGRSDRDPDAGAEVVERGKGRCFFVTSDQDGNFKVGDFFKVDQGTGTVTFSSSIAISNLDGLGFKRGVAVAEFSTDNSFFDNATDTVPTEQAIRGYIERRLGYTHNGSTVIDSNIIPPGAGFMCLNGDLSMKADMDLGNNKIVQLATPVSPADATTKNYVDAFLRRQGGASRSDIESFAMREDVLNPTGTVGSISGSGPWVGTITGLGTTTNVAVGNTIVATNGVGSLGTGGLYTVTFVGATSVDFSAAGGTTPIAGTITAIKIYAGNINMNDNKITNLATPTTDFDATTKKYVDDLAASQNEIRELGGVSLPNPITGVTNNSLFVFNGTNFTWGAQAGDVLFTLVTNTLTSAIQPGVIINSDVNASAAIDQSKLNMTIATTRAAAPTGTAAQIQAASGLASFDSANFEITSGFVGIKANGVALSEIAQIGSDTVIGNSSGSNATPSAVSFATVVQEGGALYLQQFSTNGAVVRIGVNSYTTVAYTASYTGAGENNTIVQRDSSGGFSASTINATTQFNVSGAVALKRSADATPFLEIYTPQGTISSITRTVSSVVNTTMNGDLTLSASGRSNTANGNWSVTGAWTLASGATLESTYAADIAEYYQGDKEYETGTVLMIGGEFDVTLAKGQGTTKVAGVVSNNAAFIMYKECPGLKNLVALQGRVPCKVIGKIEKGDLLVVGIVPGVAMASSDAKAGSIIGKALQNYDSDHVGIIEVMVGKH